MDIDEVAVSARLTRPTSSCRDGLVRQVRRLDRSPKVRIQPGTLGRWLHLGSLGIPSRLAYLPQEPTAWLMIAWPYACVCAC